MAATELEPVLPRWGGLDPDDRLYITARALESVLVVDDLAETESNLGSGIRPADRGT